MRVIKSTKHSNNIYVISDTHFHHSNIIREDYCNRPFESIEEMNEVFVKNWNEKVSENTSVFHLGDFGFRSRAQNLETYKKLNGNIICLRGNHDKSSHPINTTNDIINLFLPKEDLFPRQMIVLFHYPILSWERASYGSVNIHGHTHGKLIPYEKIPGSRIDVSIDALAKIRSIQYKREIRKEDYSPIRLDYILSFLKTGILEE